MSLILAVQSCVRSGTSVVSSRVIVAHIMWMRRRLESQVIVTNSHRLDSFLDCYVFTTCFSKCFSSFFFIFSFFHFSFFPFFHFFHTFSILNFQFSALYSLLSALYSLRSASQILSFSASNIPIFQFFRYFF